MIIAHLLFGHLLADYILQTNWLVTRKGKFIVREITSWDGLLLHGFLVWIVTLSCLASHVNIVLPYVTLLALLHTLQDGLKIWISTQTDYHPFLFYILDQALHLALIVGLQALAGSQLQPGPDAAEVYLMFLGAAVIAITRFYEVTWWANWGSMYDYLKRWRIWSYGERITILLLAAVNLWLIAPLALLPRLIATRRHHQPVWHQRGGLLEMLIGAAFALALGLAL